MNLKNSDQLKNELKGVLQINGPNVRVLNENILKEKTIDDLVHAAVFSPDDSTCQMARWIIRRAAASLGIFPASIQSLYEAMGRGEAGGSPCRQSISGDSHMTAPQAVFRAALKGKVGPFIFEIARSEIGYTGQRPAEYTAVITAAAVKTGYRGPLFLQGDHFQISTGKFSKNPESEVNAVKDLIKEAISASFFNIDIDSSTIVDLGKTNTK